MGGWARDEVIRAWWTVSLNDRKSSQTEWRVMEDEGGGWAPLIVMYSDLCTLDLWLQGGC